MQLFSLGSAPKPPDQRGRTQFTERQAKTILAKGAGMLSSYDFTLNPYTGCQFSCSYCYAAFFQADEQKRDSWGRWVDVKINALDLLKRHRGAAGKRIFVGSVTDPYQPVERELRLTRSLLQHLATLNPQPRIHIQTRSPIICDDISVLRKFSHLTVGMSITTDDELVRKAFEPACASIPQRVEAAARLVQAGISLAVCISPMLPISDPARFARQLRDIGADRYWTGYFHEGQRDFASGTRPGAFALAKAHGWNFDEFQRTAVLMSEILPDLRGVKR